VHEGIEWSTFKKGKLVMPWQTLNELKADQSGVDALWRCVHVNACQIQLDPGNSIRYVTSTIGALTACAKHAPSFPDIAQLLSPLSEHAEEKTVFQATSSCILWLMQELQCQANE